MSFYFSLAFLTSGKAPISEPKVDPFHSVLFSKSQRNFLDHSIVRWGGNFKGWKADEIL